MARAIWVKEDFRSEARCPLPLQKVKPPTKKSKMPFLGIFAKKNTGACSEFFSGPARLCQVCPTSFQQTAGRGGRQGWELLAGTEVLPQGEAPLRLKNSRAAYGRPQR